VLTWKRVVFWFCKVVCLHTQGEVRQFDTLRCVIHSRLIWCKNYRNRSIFAKVVAKSFGPHFLCPAVYNKMSAATCPQQTGVVRWKPEAHCCNASYVLVADDSSSIVHCPSHGHILKTKQDRSIVTMEHCQDSVAAFNSSPDAPPPLESTMDPSESYWLTLTINTGNDWFELAQQMGQFFITVTLFMLTQSCSCRLVTVMKSCGW